MKTLVVAPHPDDEILGCGGTLFRRISQGGTVGWLLMTEITEKAGWTKSQIAERASEIDFVRTSLMIAPENFYSLGFPTAELDRISMNVLVKNVSEIFKNFEPEEVLLPYPGDVHSDHRVTFEVGSSCIKWFRFPSIKRVLVYETVSETDFGVDPRDLSFRPNVFIDISDFLQKKLELLHIYKSEIGAYPFPRSEICLRALAQMRGGQSGFEAAESFMLLKEIQN